MDFGLDFDSMVVDFFMWLSGLMGWQTAVRLKEIVGFICGIIAGTLLCVIALAYLFQGVEGDSELSGTGILALRLETIGTNGRKRKTIKIPQPQTATQTLSTVTAVIILKLKPRTISINNVKRVKLIRKLS